MTNDSGYIFRGQKKEALPCGRTSWYYRFNPGLELEVRAQVETTALQVIEVTAGRAGETAASQCARRRG